jgi:hypothetical protein
MKKKLLLYIDEACSEIKEIMISIGFLIILIGAIPLINHVYEYSILRILWLLSVSFSGCVVVVHFLNQLTKSD